MTQAEPGSDRWAGRRATFIVNPAAGRPRARRRLDAAIADAAARFGIVPTVVATRAPHHATTLAREAVAAGADLVFACGGDGTLNEVIQGIDAPDVVVGVVPSGTSNVWAREAGVPRDPHRALTAQLEGAALRLDVGRAGGRRFLLMGSYGYDAAAVAAVRHGLKRWLRQGAYVWSGVAVALRYRGTRLTVQFDDEPPQPLDVLMLFGGNTRSYAAVTSITPQASAVDGRLDCVLFTGRARFWPALTMVPQVFLGRHLRSRRTICRRARRVVLAVPGNGPLPPLHVDGDAVAAGDGVLAVEPGALWMFVPRADRPVFQPGA